MGRAPVVDQDGRFSVQGLAPGAYMAVATSPGFRPDVTAIMINGTGAVHRFALRGDGTITGTVRAARTSAPLADAMALRNRRFGSASVGSTHTGPDGTFTLAGLPAGRTTVTASLSWSLSRAQPRCRSPRTCPRWSRCCCNARSSGSAAG